MNELYKISIYVYCIYRRGKCNFFLASKLSFSIWVCSLYGPDPISIIFSKSCCCCCRCALVLSTVYRLYYTTTIYLCCINFKTITKFQNETEENRACACICKQSVILKEKVVLYVFSLQNTNCNCINIYQSIEFVHAYVNKLDFF